MWPDDDDTPEPAAWINFNAATSERNVSFVCESELASIPLWPEPPQRKPLTDDSVREEAYRRCNAGWALMCKKMVAAEREAFVEIINDNTDGDGICCADDLLAAIRAHGIGSHDA
jgi:hypothetical protein